MIVTSAKIRENVQPILDGCDNIVAAYLFGSVATSRQRPGSDIDIAILLVEAQHHDRKALLDQLLPPLCRTLRGDVHLLFLNDASYLVRAQVFGKGELLYMRDSRKLAVFRMKSMSMFADFAPYLRMTRKGLQSRLRKTYGG